MKFLSVILLLALPAQVLSADINYETLSNRFVTSVKEAQVDADFLKIQEVQDCVAQNSITNVQNKDEILKKQRDAANCLRAKLAAVPDGDLTKLGEKLQLDAYGVVKGKSNQALVNYLSGRLEKALYGTEGGPNGKVVRLGQQKIVDQKVFVDIYETQLGKNILLEISNYCFSRLNVDPNTTGNRLSKLAAIDPTNTNTFNSYVTTELTGFDDRGNLRAAITDTTNIYDEIKNDLSAVTGTLSARDAANKLNNLFMVCVAAIPKMCEFYEACLCKFKENNPDYPNSPACNPNPRFACPTRPTTMPERGSHSCHVASRLRGYRTNLEAVGETKKRFDEKYVSESGTQSYTGKGTYDKSQPGPNQSIDDLTSMTTSEVDGALQVSQLANETGAIPDDCSTRPEDPECAKFFYNGSEVQKFAQSSAGYSAATLIESEKINRLASKDDELKAYLKARGYFDLEAKVGQGNSADIVAAARSRFEAEREATFTEMTKAFERKQFTTGIDNEDAAQKQIRADQVKKEYQNKGKEFQQLILFNNVVSSYLELKRVGSNGELESAGKNLKAFTRETRTAQGQAGSEGALTYFAQINTGEESKISDSDTPVVNIDFLDAILGKNVTPPANTGTTPGGPIE